MRCFRLFRLDIRAPEPEQKLSKSMWIETEYRQVNTGMNPEICLSPLSFLPARLPTAPIRPPITPCTGSSGASLPPPSTLARDSRRLSRSPDPHANFSGHHECLSVSLCICPARCIQASSAFYSSSLVNLGMFCVSMRHSLSSRIIVTSTVPSTLSS